LTRQASGQSVIARGVAAGVAGTGVMTASQKFVEMHITRRGESYATANSAERMTPIDPGIAKARRQLNYVTHLTLAMMWGAA
jgi:hypothetical protein